MPDPPPRAPTFPSFIDQLNTNTLSSDDYIEPMDPSTTSSSVPTSDNVPVVPLPLAGGKSRIRAVFLWRDPKLSGVVFASFMLFFYLTLIRGLSVLSVIGFLFGLYVALRYIAYNVNKPLAGKLDKYIARPPFGTPLFKRESFVRIIDTIVEEGNENQATLRDIIYCDKNPVVLTCLVSAIMLYFIGTYCSFLVVLFVASLLLFTLPLAYEKNKKQVDDALAKASDTATKHIETGCRVATERAVQLRDVAAERSAPLLEKAPPVAKQFAERIGLTPKKSKPE